MRDKQNGFSLIELLIVVAIILIIAAIAIPNLLRAKIAANQASAVGSLRTLNTACIAYSTSYGQFPAALTNLGPIASGSTASSTSADLIDSVLASGTKSGYTFTYTAGAGNQSYSITAKPITAATNRTEHVLHRSVRCDPRGYFRHGCKRKQHSNWLANPMRI
jgi:type IV pilus assembly protein PilA